MIARRARLMLLAPLAMVASLSGASCAGSRYWPTQPTEPTTPPTPPPTAEVVVGRPIRRRNGAARRVLSRASRRRTGALHLTDRQALALPTATRLAVGDYWRTTGEYEHASVAAFVDLARRLVAVDAPADLVARAHRAAAQEDDHARRCFELASRYLGTDVRPGRLPVVRRAHRGRHDELRALAVEAVLDGMFNEGVAAWLATRSGERALDGRVAAALAVIAADETDHARLAADVLAFALDAGDDAVADGVERALLQLPLDVTVPGAAADANPRLLADHGVVLPGPAVTMACADIRAAVIARAGALLARRAQPAAA